MTTSPVAPGVRTRGSSLSRRGVLGLAAAGVLAACDRAPVRFTSTSGGLTTSHWPGREVAWTMLIPAGGPPLGLVLVLHGYGGTGAKAIDIFGLTEHVPRTRLAVAAIDGGNYYWHARRAGMDPGAMVIDDFRPLALRTAGLPADSPVGFMGYSMGGYGSMLLAGELGRKRVFGVSAMSAALFLEPGESAQGAFDDREDFLAHDLFTTRSRQLAGIPIRLECGRDDPFAPANRAFHKAVPATSLTIDDGGHTGDYWFDHAGGAMDWLATLA